VQSKLKVQTQGDSVILPLTQFNVLIKHYQELKDACQEKDKVIAYLNEEIRQYNERFNGVRND